MVIFINITSLNDFEQCSYNSFVTTQKRKITGMLFISRIYIQMKKYLKRSSVKTSLIKGNLLRKVSGLRKLRVNSLHNLENLSGLPARSD